ncbi:transmembrane sulfatase [Candidatus Magnetomorum sp. HK-1]|nr:transmembrane sulfatase [Candidatus Magnetomorum sp. HK-1]
MPRKKNIINNLSSLLPIFITIFMTFILTGYLYQLNFFQQSFSYVNIISSLIFFESYINEFFITYLISTILLNGSIIWILFGYIVVFGYISVNIIQFSAIYFGGEFISHLAIENIDSFYLFCNFKNSVSVLFLILIFLCLPLFASVFVDKAIANKVKKIPLRLNILLIILIAVTFKYISIHLPEVILEKKNSYYLQRNMANFSPIKELFNAFESNQNLNVHKSIHMKNLIANLIFKLDMDSKYPLVKKNIYHQPPFVKKKGIKINHPNIIVFFSEGLSARTTSIYNKKFKELTPNLYNFSKSSMVINNYYNHTAATYRGIIGQICSLYPTYGGYGGWTDNYENMPRVNYYGLTDVLKENSYKTIFFNPTLIKISHVDEMAKQIGFDNVINAEDLSEKYLNGNPPLQTDSVSDQQLYTSLIEMLKQLETKLDRRKKPFFIAVYSSETHAWNDVKKDGKQFDNGNNNTLNTIFNLDHAFGRFWQYYQSSPYSKDTIIIFTSDHAHFYDKSYVEVMKQFKETDYQSLFIDKIPFIIHDPLQELPKSFDAKNATSIDFAPSLLHYLGLNNKKNPFLGKSIFSTLPKKDYGIASYGNQFYVIDNEKIHSVKNSKKYRTLFMRIQSSILTTQHLELSNRIWDAGL